MEINMGNLQDFDNRILVFKDGQPVGLCIRLNLRTREYDRYVIPEGVRVTDSQGLKGLPVVTEVADFIVIGDCPPEMWRR